MTLVVSVSAAGECLPFHFCYRSDAKEGESSCFFSLFFFRISKNVDTNKFAFNRFKMLTHHS